MTKPILNVENLKLYFTLKKGFFNQEIQFVKAVDDVSFTIYPGEAVGLVGESGSGKTTLGMGILRLISPNAGKVNFDDQDLFSLNSEKLKKLRKDLQIIFQDPFSSLNPRMTIGSIIEEGLHIHKIGHRKDRQELVLDILATVGISPDFYDRYPHEFSGGQRQRIGIARALVLKPKFVICDEPVSALDVSVQVQVLKLMQKLQQEFQLTYLFIAHDLAVVDYFCNRIIIIYLGKIMEIADRDTIVKAPLHPYTQALISAIPHPDPDYQKQETILHGDIPSPLNPPSGCVFHTRCPQAIDDCKKVIPALDKIKEGHYCACIRVK